MPADQFTIGGDVTVTIVTPEVGPITLDLVTGFTAKQLSSTESPLGLDGIPRHVTFFKGWQGKFDLDRRTSTLDDYFALKESNFWAGIAAPPASITQLIREVAGNITQWRFTGVILTYDDAGDYKGDSTVKQSMSFLASKRLKIA
jgi:hypothetical protein